ncbi:MAG TPA: MaoC family dehydratase N-terminal domain-containing protein [Actinomycetota bacterium]|nr:MaoC family dehydratase N-terminal domain-containing protein [Actinomycetota bacterium]
MVDVKEEFERATAYAITDEDVERAKLLLGIETADARAEHLTEATEDALRNFAHGYGDDNPLFCDPEYAAGTRWGAQIAPPLILTSLNAPLLGDPLDPELKKRTKSLFKGIHAFVSAGDWDWYRPIHPGDRIYTFGGQESIEVKRSEFAGRSVLRTLRRVHFNQRAEVVAIVRILMIYAERKTAKEKGKYSAIEPTRYTDEDLAAIDEIYAQERPRGPEPRYWEDVEVGEPLPKMVKGPLTVTDLICFHAGGYGFTPYAPSAARLAYKTRQRIPAFYVRNEQGVPDTAQRVHWDADWAKAIGNPMPYDYGALRETYLAHLLTDWIGDDGWLLRQHDEVRRFNYVGDTQFVTGEVTGKRLEGSSCLVEIEMRATNQRGEVTAPGNATVMLPSREHGPVVPPEPPLEAQRTAVRMLERHGELVREARARRD